MKKKLWLLAMMAMSLPGFAQLQNPTSCTADNGNGTYTNPLFYDEFSDPDILRVGDDYYLAGTTMHSVPGLVILHSRDLVNWENVSYCFDRFDFDDDAFSLKNHKEVYGQGIWAPAIRQRAVLRLLERERQGAAMLHLERHTRPLEAPQHEGSHLRPLGALRRRW